MVRALLCLIVCGLLELHFRRVQIDLVRVILNKGFEDFYEVLVLVKKS